MKYGTSLGTSHTVDVYKQVTAQDEDTGSAGVTFVFSETIACTVENNDDGKTVDLYYKSAIPNGWQVRNIKDRRGAPARLLRAGNLNATVKFSVEVLSLYGYPEGYKMVIE